MHTTRVECLSSQLLQECACILPFSHHQSLSHVQSCSVLCLIGLASVSDCGVHMMSCSIADNSSCFAAVDWHSASFPVNHWQSGGAGAGVQSGTCDTKHPPSVMHVDIEHPLHVMHVWYRTSFECHACKHNSWKCASKRAWDWCTSLAKQSNQYMFNHRTAQIAAMIPAACVHACLLQLLLWLWRLSGDQQAPWQQLVITLSAVRHQTQSLN